MLGDTFDFGGIIIVFFIELVNGTAHPVLALDQAGDAASQVIYRLAKDGHILNCGLSTTCPRPYRRVFQN